MRHYCYTVIVLLSTVGCGMGPAPDYEVLGVPVFVSDDGLPSKAVFRAALTFWCDQWRDVAQLSKQEMDDLLVKLSHVTYIGEWVEQSQKGSWFIEGSWVVAARYYPGSRYIRSSIFTPEDPRSAYGPSDWEEWLFHELTHHYHLIIYGLLDYDHDSEDWEDEWEVWERYKKTKETKEIKDE